MSLQFGFSIIYAVKYFQKAIYHSPEFIFILIPAEEKRMPVV